MEERELALGMSEAPQVLKRKTQEYANALSEVQMRLGVLTGIPGVTSAEPQQPQHQNIRHVTTEAGRLVVGHQHGEAFMGDGTPPDLHALMSPNAQWLMQLADTECFAVDDCIILTNSRNFQGWSRQGIQTTLVSTPVPLPYDLEQLRDEKLPAVERHYINNAHYRLASFTPSFNDPDLLRVTLAPIGFFDYYSLSPFFDEPLLTALDGSNVSIRQKYGNTALTYISTERGVSLIPAPISIQCLVITKQQQILLMRRSSLVAFYPHHWSASFEETMNGPADEAGRVAETTADTNFFDAAARGLEEEFAISKQAITSSKVLSLNVEYLTLSVDVIMALHVDLTADEIRHSWLLRARDKNEATKLDVLPGDLDSIVKKLFTRTLWHPTSRMRLIQYLFHTYGIEPVVRAISAGGITYQA